MSCWEGDNWAKSRRRWMRAMRTPVGRVCPVLDTPFLTPQGLYYWPLPHFQSSRSLGLPSRFLRDLRVSGKAAITSFPTSLTPGCPFPLCHWDGFQTSLPFHLWQQNAALILKWLRMNPFHFVAVCYCHTRMSLPVNAEPWELSVRTVIWTRPWARSVLDTLNRSTIVKIRML